MLPVIKRKADSLPRADYFVKYSLGVPLTPVSLKKLPPVRRPVHVNSAPRGILEPFAAFPPAQPPRVLPSSLFRKHNERQRGDEKHTSSPNGIPTSVAVRGDKSLL